MMRKTIPILVVLLLVSFGASAVAPSNDDFVDAALLAAGQSVSQSTVDATTEAGEPEPCGAIGSTVWFDYTPPTAVTLVAETFGSGFDTVVAVHTGSDLADLELVECNDDSGGTFQSRVIWAAAAGTTYRIQVGGYDSDSGDLEMHLESTVPPAHDDRAYARDVFPIEYTDRASTLAATEEHDEPNPGCAPIGATVWYRLHAEDTSLASVSTAGSDFDTVLGVYDSSGLPVLPLGCDDDGGADLTSSLDFLTVEGATYYIQVGGYGGDRGNLAIEILSGPLIL